jgi:hypothetical protein
MVLTRTKTGGRITLPEGRNLPAQLHNYAPRKYGDWDAPYAKYKPVKVESVPEEKKLEKL